VTKAITKMISDNVNVDHLDGYDFSYQS